MSKDNTRKIGQLEALSESAQERLPFSSVYEQDGEAFYEATSKDGNEYTLELGKIITVDNITQDIDNGKIEITLNNGVNSYKLRPSQLKPEEVIALADFGFPVNFQNRFGYYFYIENLRSISKRKYSHSQLGWGKLRGTELIFKYRNIIKADKVIASEYSGEFDLSRKGTAKTWSDGIKELVIGHLGLEVVLISSVCAIINGLIGYDLSLDTPMIHIYNTSSVGKSTSLKVAASLVGNCNSENSFFASWSGTSNALISLINNCPFLTLLDDTSSATIKNRESFVFKVSTGKNKLRLNSSLKQVKMYFQKGMVISSGEAEFIKENEIKGGLHVRLLQIGDLELTKNADHAQKLSKFACENYGTAIIPLVQNIMKTGKEELINEFNVACTALELQLDKGKFNARLAKIYTLFIISARLLNRTFDLGINEESIIDFFINYHNLNKAESDITECAWEYMKNTIAMNTSNFETILPVHFSYKKPNINKELYGTILREDKHCVVSIIKTKCDELLEKAGFNNTNEIYRAFKEKEYIMTDDGCYTKKRTIGSVRVRCIVFVISDDEMPNFLSHLKEKDEKRSRKIKKKVGRK